MEANFRPLAANQGRLGFGRRFTTK